MYDNKGSDLIDYEDSDFNTIMASDITFTGKIHFTKPFLIRGKVNGTITAEGDLVVDTGAVVNANIQAERVLVKGAIKGNVHGSALVFVTSSGSITGDISSSQVVLEPGSLFSGRCTMNMNMNADMNMANMAATADRAAGKSNEA